ncbi:MAG: hypothetical protein IPF55_15155 [Rhodoferax sp.]|nr:hypothetical protein [Rhodoferax sp.]
MSVLFFQVPDPDPQTDGLASSRLELRGDQTGPDFARLCKLLGLSRLPSNAVSYATVLSALTAWQRNHGLMSDGVVGPFMWAMLERARGQTPQEPSWLAQLPAERLGKLFPFTTRKNLQIYAPYVLAALDAAGYGPQTRLGAQLCQMALATIRAETEGFAPISEGRSRYNTPAGGVPFSKYDPDTAVGKQLGNTQIGDGERFKGRGFVQLTGRDNYTRYGQLIGLELDKLPFLANYPDVAAVLLVRFLRDKAAKIVAALSSGDEALARSLVNGGSHGLDRFQDTLARWHDTIAPTLPAQGKRPARSVVPAVSLAQRTGSATFVLPVKNDPVDLRDLPYRPPLRSLPPVWPTESMIKTYMPLYHAQGLVLDQGQEGACTGFGLASVINYLRFSACGTDAQRKKLNSVSPRMLYELARRYDEYEGHDYEGSSCRGALKGWHKHGVCFEQDWDYQKDLMPSNPQWATRALQNTLGVYYRIDKSNLVDLQAAIANVGAIFVSAHIHAGWDLLPAPSAAPAAQRRAGPARRRDTIPWCRSITSGITARAKVHMRSHWSATTHAASSSKTPGAPPGVGAALPCCPTRIGWTTAWTPGWRRWACRAWSTMRRYRATWHRAHRAAPDPARRPAPRWRACASRRRNSMPATAWCWTAGGWFTAARATCFNPMAWANWPPSGRANGLSSGAASIPMSPRGW